MKNPKTINPVTPKIRRVLASLLIFALVVTLAPVQSLAQTVQCEKTVAGQLPDTAVYTVGDCTVTYDTALHEALSPDITITITNHGQQPIHKWQLRFHYPTIINPSSDIQINSHQNGYYIFTPTQQTMEIPAGQTVQFSLAVSGEILPEPPEQIDLIINDEEFAPLPTPTTLGKAKKSISGEPPSVPARSPDSPTSVSAVTLPCMIPMSPSSRTKPSMETST